jgi:two-component system KDP operon response regulator KdpE
MSVQPRILVVDDDQEMRAFLQTLLKRHGMTVLVAPDAPPAMRQLRRAPPDLVLLDLGLPSIDGAVMLQDIRVESSVPIIVVTGRTADEDELCALQLGADDYVTKPFLSAELVARIQAVLRRSQPHRGADSAG